MAKRETSRFSLSTASVPFESRSLTCRKAFLRSELSFSILRWISIFDSSGRATNSSSGRGFPSTTGMVMRPAGFIWMTKPCSWALAWICAKSFAFSSSMDLTVASLRVA